jgi:uncharacterized protein (TIGR03435 family)
VTNSIATNSIATNSMASMALCAGLASIAAAQSAPPAGIAFEVASIRPSGPSHSGNHAHGNSSEIFLTNMTPKRLVEIAYQVKDYGFQGPDWMDTLHFDLSAKMPEGSTRGQYPEMLKALLIERFRLAVHRETKIIPGYALMPAKSGFKLKAVEANGSS